jgi:hypothetical protein
MDREYRNDSDRGARHPALTWGRQIKFTPERIEQIKNLVERRKSREEIAELIGVTVGSLQVTCSRLGISLRRPTFNNGTVPIKRNQPRSDRVSSRGFTQPESAEQAQAATPCRTQDLAPSQEWRKRANEAGTASFAIRMQYRGEERTTELPLTQDMIGQLAFEAAFRNVSIGELIGKVILGVLKEDLLQTVLERKEPNQCTAAR